MVFVFIGSNRQGRISEASVGMRCKCDGRFKALHSRYKHTDRPEVGPCHWDCFQGIQWFSFFSVVPNARPPSGHLLEPEAVHPRALSAKGRYLGTWEMENHERHEMTRKTWMRELGAIRLGG